MFKLKGWRRSQFTIRGVLLAITFFCFWLAWLSSSARQQQEARGKLRNLGGETYSCVFSSGIQPLCNIAAHCPAWVNSVLQVPLLASGDFVSNVTAIRFGTHAHVDADAVSVLRALPYLEHILLDGARVEPDFILALDQLPQVRRLTFANVPLTPSMVERLSSLQRLESLNLVGGVYGDESLPALAQLRGLQQLDLTRSRVGWGAIWRLEQLLPQCNIMPSTRSHHSEFVTVRLAFEDGRFVPLSKESDDTSLECRMACEVVAIRPDGLLGLESHTKYSWNNETCESTLEGDVHITDVLLTDNGTPMVDSASIANLKTEFRQIRHGAFHERPMQNTRERRVQDSASGRRHIKRHVLVQHCP